LKGEERIKKELEYIKKYKTRPDHAKWYQAKLDLINLDESLDFS
jgi:hypothetical protein